MLRSLKNVFGYSIQAEDGEIGQVRNFYFDEKDWEIRYLIVETGPWILGRKVLIMPDVLGKPNWAEKNFPVNLTRSQIKDSPDIKTALPISRQQQIALHEYFRWPTYWNTETSLPTSTVSTTPIAGYMSAKETRQENKNREVMERMMQQNSTLRSAKELIGYQVQGEDAELGFVDDIILNDETWQLIYLVLDTSSMLLKGKKTLLAISWIKWVTYKEQAVHIDLMLQNIEDSPPYDPQTPINRSYEEVLYDYHGKPYLWVKK
jgi:sporulation protein YlmC with PRC-barrel domain